MRQSRNAESAETRFFGSISSSSIRSLLPKSISSKQRSTSNPNKIPKSNAENTPPTHPNVQVPPENTTTIKQLQSTTPSSQIEDVGSESTHDSPVKVVVRIRPVDNDGGEGDQNIIKVSSDSLYVGDRQFTFDMVFDSDSNQEDIFQSVGVPLVQNALAGYNTSVLSYGQSGSGKTYTMWGPPNAMAEEPSSISHHGIVPRIFKMLFSELEREHHSSEENQFNYQCRCSFLEIYNDQIGDLLDPVQQNLELKEDYKNALYVENLTEEYVTSYEDVTQILIKGLSSRKTGATSLNPTSSRSHIIFTFVLESWCKGTSSKGFSSSKTSRITLIDLAGMDTNKVEDAGRICPRESRYVKKSLSQLGRLVDALTKETQSFEAEDISNRSSCLARLLQESLGGNSKLSVICAISPDNKNNSETVQTLRFGQRVRSIRNKPVINAIKEDRDNGLSDQIRKLKEELVKEKANVHSSTGNRNGYFQGRESLNQLRISLNRSLLLPHMDNDNEEEVNVDEDEIRQLSQQINELYSSSEGGNIKDVPASEDCVQICSAETSFDADMTSGEEIEKEELNSENTSTSRAIKSTFRNNISVSSCCEPSIFDGPLLSESPKIRNTQRKSMSVSSSYLGSWNNAAESSNCKKGMLGQSLKHGEPTKSPLRSSKVLPTPDESLAASLQKGLQIIDYHQRNSALNKSLASFSFEHLTLTPCPEIDMVDSSVKTTQERPSTGELPAVTFLCASCGMKVSDQASAEVQDSLNSWIDAVENSENAETLKDKVPKHLENEMAKAIKREKELEIVCKEQRARIEELSQLVQKYKGENDINSIVVYGQEANSLKDEDKQLLRGSSSENLLQHISEGNCEINRDNSLDATEKEALLKEIQNLRSKLQLCSDGPIKKSTDKLRSSLISRSMQLQKNGVLFNGGEELETERQRWTEMESEWICLTDELRVDLESNRQRAERVEMELKMEKKCAEELDDALKRAVLGHAKMVEHYAELQERYDDVVSKHSAIMEGIAEVKRAAAKAGKKGHAKFAKSLAAELSTMRVEREREREFLKKENKSLKIQLRDTAEAVHAAGELLVRLREAEHAASVTQDNLANVQEENETLRKKVEKMKRKHKMEMITMKQYIAESKLPQSALKPLYREDEDDVLPQSSYPDDDDQAWRAEFGAIYQDHF